MAKDIAMRSHIIAAFLFACAPAAFAQPVATPPTKPAPAATAPLPERAEWCDQYASWFVAMTPSSKSPAPADVRDTQRLEVELNACKLDPRDYERQTRAEAERAVETAAG